MMAPPATATALSASPFSLLSDDLLLLILSKLDSEPHHWPRLCCVSPRFSSLILSHCYTTKCLRSLPPFLIPLPPSSPSSLLKLSLCCPGLPLPGNLHPAVVPHLSPTPWTVSREEGSKLLASRFRGDRLYVSSWPGCPHTHGGRNHMVFRGVFHDFGRSAVRTTIRDSGREGPGCVFCACSETWDLHALFCLRRVFDYHGDGEPLVRAYVCENGHVTGAWTDRPRYR